MSDGPSNPLVSGMMTDFYQITMSYVYWKAGKTEDHAVFDLYFRKNPFGGEFTLFGGLEEAVRLVRTLKFTPADVEYIRSRLPAHTEDEFFEYLASVDGSKITLRAIPEGSVIFPKEPLLIVEG